MRPEHGIGEMGEQPASPPAPKVISVIRTKDRRGNGTEQEPTRIVTQYWTLEGELLAERDPWLDEEHKRAVAGAIASVIDTPLSPGRDA